MWGERIDRDYGRELGIRTEANHYIAKGKPRNQIESKPERIETSSKPIDSEQTRGTINEPRGE